MSRKWVGLALIAMMASAAVVARADSHVRIVRLSFISGDVQIDRNQGAGFEKAILNMPVTEGVKIVTGENALAEIEFEEGSTLRLTPDAAVDFPQLSLRDSGGKATTVQVQHGIVYFNVTPRAGDEFSVRMADRIIQLNRSAHFRVDVTPTDVQIAVFKGEVPVNGPNGLVAVKKNDTVTLFEDGAGKYELAKSVTSDEYDSWDSERINYQQEYASRSYSRNLPYGYGVSDLSYYGAWSSYPGYGYLWRPYGVSMAWDPFYGNGAWGYDPMYGYLWMSSYPWGWMPYRYGNWVFVPNYGWGWQPGAMGSGGWYTGWTGYPRVINPPTGWVPPQPPKNPPPTGPGRTVISNSSGEPMPQRRGPRFLVGDGPGTDSGAAAGTLQGGITQRTVQGNQYTGPAPSASTSVATRGTPTPALRTPLVQDRNLRGMRTAPGAAEPTMRGGNSNHGYRGRNDAGGGWARPSSTPRSSGGGSHWGGSPPAGSSGSHSSAPAMSAPRMSAPSSPAPAPHAGGGARTNPH